MNIEMLVGVIWRIMMKIPVWAGIIVGIIMLLEWIVSNYSHKISIKGKAKAV